MKRVLLKLSAALVFIATMVGLSMASFAIFYQPKTPKSLGGNK